MLFRSGEGHIDAYYGLTTTVDVVGLGPWQLELPWPAWLGPPVTLIVLAIRSGPERRARVRRHLLALACLAAATLPTPVLISTASAIEVQCFVAVYALATGLLVEEAAQWRQRSSWSLSTSA